MCLKKGNILEKMNGLPSHCQIHENYVTTPVKKLIFINRKKDYLLRQLVIKYNVIQEHTKLLFIDLNYPKDILKYILMLYIVLFESQSEYVCICDNLDDCLYNIKIINRICCEACSPIQCLPIGKLCKHCHFYNCIKCHMTICLSCRKLEITHRGYLNSCVILNEYNDNINNICQNSGFF